MAYKTNQFDDEIVRLLKAGAVGLVPADTIYGLSCRALDEAAVIRLHHIKKREADKPFIVLISEETQLEPLGINEKDAHMAKTYWPGPLTLVCPASSAPSWLQMGAKTLAVRLPDYPELLGLISKVGPIISTSGNLAGGEPAKTAAEALKYFGNNLDFYVDTGPHKGKPSTLVRTRSDKLEIIRQGALELAKEDTYEV